MFQKYKWITKVNNKNLILKSIIKLKIRNFFFIKNIFEVNTPNLCSSISLNSNIQSIYTNNYTNFNKIPLYLQNSPEYKMKKLIISGCSSIYQLSPAFRGSDISNIHNPEFQILEWYRKKYNTKMLIKEIIELLENILKIIKIIKITYEMLFEKILNIKPKNESIYKIKNIIKLYNIKITKKNKINKNDYLNLLLKYIIEPKLKKKKIYIIYNYYYKQPDLAKTTKKISKRFEIYINKIEIANGAEELKNYNTHIKKFNKFNIKKKKLKKIINNNIKFISSLYYGLPKCSGIAIGIE
mgnify:FL=1